MNEKSKKFLPYIAINAAGAITVLLCFFIEPLAAFGFGVALVIITILVIEPVKLMIVSLIIIAVNTAAFIKVESGKTDSGILCSVFCGSLGGFAAVHTVNKKFEKTKTVNIIFNVHLWLLSYLGISYALYSFYYGNS
ncbi:MAG: hypothetical protein NC192_09665, partial [Muribaculaceae bacterium]|nr:hypothetical protein [Muribaculaceae bacterium]